MLWRQLATWTVVGLTAAKSKLLILSVLGFALYLENQSLSYIGLPEFHVHDGALANGSCWCASGRFPDWTSLSQDAKHGSTAGHHPCWRFVVQSDANGLFHKTVHIARRSVQNDGVAEVDTMPCVDTVFRHRILIRLMFLASSIDGSPCLVHVYLATFTRNSVHARDIQSYVVLDRPEHMYGQLLVLIIGFSNRGLWWVR
jgi:hypothetical protein